MVQTPIAEVMTKEVISISETDVVAEAVKLFDKYNIHHIPVLGQGGGIVGILSSTDIERMRTGASLFKNPKREEYDDAIFNVKWVQEIMTRGVVTLGVDQTVMDAYKIFKENKFRCIPIVNDDALVGIVTQIDMLHYFFQSEF